MNHTMSEQDEKATVTVDNTEPSKSIVADATNPDKAGDSDSSNEGTRNPVRHMSDDEYPQGFRLVLLAGASLVAVFLIALDQVSNPPCDTLSLNDSH
jgi:hypothetical protein